MKKFIVFLIMVIASFAAKAQTFNNTNCTDSITPTPIGYSSVRVDGDFVVVYYQSSTPCYSDFILTPAYVKGNTERRLTNLTQSTGGSQIWRFNKQQLIDAAIALGANNGPIKYRFIVVTVNNVLTSPEAKTVTENIR